MSARCPMFTVEGDREVGCSLTLDHRGRHHYAGLPDLPPTLRRVTWFGSPRDGETVILGHDVQEVALPFTTGADLFPVVRDRILYREPGSGLLPV